MQNTRRHPFVLGIDCHILDELKQGSQTYLHSLLAHFPRTALWSDLPVQFRMFSALRHQVYEALGDRGTWSRIRRSSKMGRFLDLPLQMKAEGCSLGWYQYNVAPTARLVHHPFIVTIHDVLYRAMPEYYSLPMRTRLGILCRTSAKRARHILTISTYSKQAIMNLYGITPDRITIAPCAVEAMESSESDATSEARADSAIPDAEYLLYLGRLDPRKNLDNIIRAFSRLTESDPDLNGLHLVLAGPGDTEAHRKLASAHGIADRVHLLGEVSDDVKETLYRGCRVFVYPSYGEGFGLPVLEAFAHGKEVVTSRNSSLEEIASPYAHFVYDPGDPDAIVAAIGEALTQSRDQNRSALLENHANRYSWTASAETVLRVIQSCI